jgi:hypothetical protein
MSKLGMIRAGVSSINYLDDRLLACYFEAREHETYYRSLKHAGSRRDFHEVIIPMLMDLVGEILSAPNTEALDAILATPHGTVVRWQLPPPRRPEDCILLVSISSGSAVSSTSGR